MIKQIIYNSNDYRASVDLRSQILREPLGLKFADSDLAYEKEELIYGYFIDNTIISTIQFILSKDKAKLRQFATKESYQNQGIGNKLYRFCEPKLQKQNINEIYCHCRVEAIPFYLKNGYKIVSEEFFEVGIAHVKMTKPISA